MCHLPTHQIKYVIPLISIQQKKFACRWIQKFEKIKLNQFLTMRAKWFSSMLFFSIALIVIESATATFETISDDDLVERIRSNEFVIVLFCK